MYEAAETDQVEDFYNFLRLLPLGEILGLIFGVFRAGMSCGDGF